MCECRTCTFRFFDTRLTDAEVQKLYANYRGDEYFKTRRRHEFWYSKSANEGIGGDAAEIESRKKNLGRVLGERASLIGTVLDYGGDRGQFIPDGLGHQRFVYEISDVKPVEGVTRIDELDGRKFDLIMLAHVLEHCSEPREILQKLRVLAHSGTIFYLEVPYERPSMRFAGAGAGHRRYLETLVRSRPLLTLVDFYSTVFRVKFDQIPPLGLQKCSEHLNFFNKPSFEALLNSEGFALLGSDVLSVHTNGPVNRILYGLAALTDSMRLESPNEFGVPSFCSSAKA